MTGYTKLFSEILSSTVWREPKDVKILWITMLAMADRNGMVMASIPGLADMARLTITETEAALVVLADVDKYSRSKNDEGRRIRKVDGGWFIINHPKFRARMSADERREYKTLKQREYRALPSQPPPVFVPPPPIVKEVGATLPDWTDDSACPYPEMEIEADPLAELRGKAPVKGRTEIVTPYPPDFEAVWVQYPNKAAKKVALQAWRRLSPGAKAMVEADIPNRLTDWKSKPTDKIPHFSTYLNGERWNDPMEVGAAQPKRKIY